MSAKQVPAGTSNLIKDPDDWVTGDEEITGAQKSYLRTLAEEAHEDVDANLIKAQASKAIDRLKENIRRGCRAGSKRASRPKVNR